MFCLHHSKDNVQWVLQQVNIMKNGFTEGEFIHLCHAIAKHHADPQPSLLIGHRKSKRKVQRLDGEADQPISHPRAPGTLPGNAGGEEIVRYPTERRDESIK